MRFGRQVAVFLLASVLWAGGCGRMNALQVEQPFAPQSQRSMHLTSRWGWFGAIDGRQAVLLEFPLPASVRGFKAFRVYAEVPSGFGTYAIEPTRPGGARAFFVQEVGELQGKVVIRSGEIRVAPVAFKPEQRRITLTLESDNEFRITGEVRAIDEPLEVQRFLREFRPDVQALRTLHTSAATAAASQPARDSVAAETPPVAPTPEQPSPTAEEPVESDAFLFEQP